MAWGGDFAKRPYYIISLIKYIKGVVAGSKLSTCFLNVFLDISSKMECFTVHHFAQ